MLIPLTQCLLKTIVMSKPSSGVCQTVFTILAFQRTNTSYSPDRTRFVAPPEKLVCLLKKSLQDGGNLKESLWFPQRNSPFLQLHVQWHVAHKLAAGRWGAWWKCLLKSRPEICWLDEFYTFPCDTRLLSGIEQWPFWTCPAWFTFVYVFLATLPLKSLCYCLPFPPYHEFLSVWKILVRSTSSMWWQHASHSISAKATNTVQKCCLNTGQYLHLWKCRIFC